MWEKNDIKQMSKYETIEKTFRQRSFISVHFLFFSVTIFKKYYFKSILGIAQLKHQSPSSPSPSRQDAKHRVHPAHLFPLMRRLGLPETSGLFLRKWCMPGIIPHTLQLPGYELIPFIPHDLLRWDQNTMPLKETAKTPHLIPAWQQNYSFSCN